MKDFILFIWQLPQNILGLIVILFTQAKYVKAGFWISSKYAFGVSLGKYIIFGQVVSETELNHEQGHQKQSIYLGWFYLLIIGIPSFIGNVWDRLFHKNWAMNKRYSWYYNLPWEKWADELGDVRRNLCV